MAVGKGPEETVGVDKFRGNPFRRNTGKRRMAGGKIGDDILVLLWCDGSGGVGKAAAGLHAEGRAPEESPLDLRAFFEVCRGDTPTDLRVSAERAEAGTGGVEENPVKGFAEGLGRSGCIFRMGLHDRYAEPAGLRRQQTEFVRVEIDGGDFPPVFHEGGEVKRFPPRAGAEVENPFAGPRGDETGDELGGLILDSHHLADKKIVADERGKPINMEGRIKERSGCHCEIQLFELTQSFFFCYLFIIDPEGKLWRSIEDAE